jgi:hypothetical protein
MLNEDSDIATTLVYGQNHYSDNSKTLPPALLESSWQMHKTAVYGRYEFVQKDAYELDLTGTYPLNQTLISMLLPGSAPVGFEVYLRINPSLMKMGHQQ